MMDVLTHEWAVELGWILLQILVVIGPLLIVDQKWANHNQNLQQLSLIHI